MTNLTTETITPAIAIAVANQDFPSAEDNPSEAEGAVLKKVREDWKTYDSDDLRIKIHKGCVLTMIRNRLYREYESDLARADKELRKIFTEREVAPKEGNTLISLYAIAKLIIESEWLTFDEICELFTSKSLVYLATIVDSPDIVKDVVAQAQGDQKGSLPYIRGLTRQIKVEQSDLPEEIRALIQPGNTVTKLDVADFVDVLAEIPEEFRQEAIDTVVEVHKNNELDSKTLKAIGKNTKALQEIRDYFDQLFSDDQSRETLDLGFTLSDIQSNENLEPVDLAKFLKAAIASQTGISREAVRLGRITKLSDEIYTNTGSGSPLRLILSQLEGRIIPSERDDKSVVLFPLDEEGKRQVSLTVTSKK